MADRQKRLDKLDTEYEVKTKQLVEAQRQKVLDISVASGIEVDEYKQEIESTKLQLRDIKVTKAELQDEVAELKLQREEESKAISELKIDKETLEIQKVKLGSDIIQFRREEFNLKSEISKHKTDIEPLIVQKTALIGQTSKLSTQKKELIIQRDDLLDQIETAGVDIDGKIYTKKIELEELVNYERRTREDLARQIKALADREQMVTIRERKADGQEAIIQQNANLLNL